jgi:glycosyltransferase involved in cell wall biosynthesis
MPVSVVTPNFNNGPYVQRYLETLLTDEAVGEIVVYDNGSTDGSADLLEELGGRKVRVIRGEQNLGATLGRDAAIRATKEDLICFLDGDDWLGENAVSLALESLRRDDLDLALFDWFDVDSDGSNPRPGVPSPKQPVDGWTAASMTMGGWYIHCSGVMRKSLYERARENFATHGYLSDEVLTRRLLLLARRVGACKGKMYYRRIPKTLDPLRKIDWGRTTVRSLALGVAEKLEPAAVRAQRWITLRFLLGLTRRALMRGLPRARVAGLLDEYFAIPNAWTRREARSWALDRALRMVRPFLGRNTEQPGEAEYR